MKKAIFTSALILFFHSFSFAQKDFIGVIKFKRQFGSHNDSMFIVFDKKRILLDIYVENEKNKNIIDQGIFISDLEHAKFVEIDRKKKTYSTRTLEGIRMDYHFLKATSPINFNNTNPCFRYTADSTTNLDPVFSLQITCLAAIGYTNSFIKDFTFMGLQPVIIENKIVLDFTHTNNDGSKARTYASEIIPMDSVESYFSLAGLRKVK